MSFGIVRDEMWLSLGLDWALLAPVVVVLGGAVLATLFEVVLPKSIRKPVQVVLALVAIAAGGLLAVVRALDNAAPQVTAQGSYFADSLTSFLQIAIAASALLAVLVMADKAVQGEDAFAPQVAATPGSEYEEQARKAGLIQTDVYPLTLFATGGMMLFPAAGDLITMFVALEVLSLPLYLLSGMARRRRLLSMEASFKYFVLGALSSAFFLFGAAWVYGATGKLKLSDIAGVIFNGAASSDVVLYVGVVLILIGLLFKVGAVPFHSWTPDVYQGAPTPVTGFMAACTKIAAFGVLLRILFSVVPGLHQDLKAVFWVVAIASMLVGTVIGVVTKDIKRMLAYSAIAHTGFILTGVVSLTSQGISSALFYLFTYGIATVGAFAVMSLVREVDSDGHVLGDATTLDQWRGLGRRSPLLAGIFSVFLLAFAGIPLTSGFVAKFAVFAAAFGAGGWVLAVIGLACSAAAAFFYARVIVTMFFSGEPGEVVSSGVGCGVRTTGLTQITVAISLLFTLAVGVAPSWLLNFASTMAAQLGL
ncbi:MAG: NADH-quinone oxidoreductase subunit NuoN [Micrococcales bacterium]|nr:NADH-quinone oxidoreductase subunit NuoN [Micrococcales bacterium]